MRSNYWSNSKIANYIRGTDKPEAATGKEWANWRNKAKEKPFRYWLAEEVLDKLQAAVTFPINVLYDIKYYINNRWVTKTHTLTSSLPRGAWHEFDNRVLFCLFDELVNFIEIELAWSNIAWDKEAKLKYRAPFYASGWSRWRTWRSPEAGLDYLKWASELTNADFLSDGEKHLACPTYQATSAKEMLALYDWWKNVRQNRPDPYDVSGWSKLCEDRAADGQLLLDIEDRDQEEVLATNRALDRTRQIEDQYEQEDTEMLIRLINIRRGMWT
jgi:hypothetical protein